MVTFISEEMLQKLRTIAASHECSLEEALNLAIDHTLEAQRESNEARPSVEIPDDLRRALDESA